MSEGRFQVGACAVIERPDGKVLLLRRSAKILEAGKWEFPCGRLKQFEQFDDGLRREIAEESGLHDITTVMPVATYTYMRGGQSAGHEVKCVTFWCTTKGKEDVKLSDEHDAFDWLDIDDAIDRANKESIKADLRAFRSIRKRVVGAG